MTHDTGDAFVKDGNEFRIVGGSMHYFRSLPEQWPTRLRTLRSCGFNTGTAHPPSFCGLSFYSAVCVSFFAPS
jgi:hypothetical protein